MINPSMVLVHDARRLRPQFGTNPFVTEASLCDLLDRMTEAYLASRNDRVARLLKVEIDRIETLV